MNKSAIQRYAIWARNELIDKVTLKAFEYGVSKDEVIDANADNVNGKLLTLKEKAQRQELVKKVNELGFDETIEEVAYTWFNRFIALRFMEVNNYLPTRIRVFTNENNEYKPEILKEALNLEFDGLNKQYIFNCIQENKDDELYKYLLIAQCNDMGKYLPGMFTKISDYKVLLFPDNLLREDSVVGKLISDIDEDSWSDQVQIIGWFYQYYISERHSEVTGALKKGTIKKEDIPAATQLWTTDWVVRYMVDNSLGRYWVEKNPESPLKNKLKYLATAKDGSLPVVDEKVAPTEIKFFDPCMGSGHILVYAFDVLMEIYRECGYSDRDAAANILQYNLYGLDIDDRAYQLAYFAVMMKARSYNRRILTRGVWNNISFIDETNDIELFEYEGLTNDSEMNEIGNYLVSAFKNAKEIGSLLTIEKLDYKRFTEYLINIQEKRSEDLFALDWIDYVLPKMSRIVKQASILSDQYSVVTTNPPYMGKMEGNLKKFVTTKYKEYSTDLFAVFMRRNFDFTIQTGYIGFMTPNVWMFIKSYEKLRSFIINSKSIITLIQMAKGAFFKEATVDICTFVLRNQKSAIPGLYYRLENFKGDMDIQKQKVLEANQNKNCGYIYETLATNFSKIPGSPIAYWISNRFTDLFDNIPLSDIVDVKTGLQTGNNDKYLRFWFEVNYSNIEFYATSDIKFNKRWYPHTKGGEYRKWYGNYEYVIDWKNNGESIKNENGSVIRGERFYFKPGITWSHTTSGGFSGRILPEHFIINVESPTVFTNKYLYYIIGLLNSCVGDALFEIMNSSLHYLVGNVSKIPLVLNNNYNDLIEEIIHSNISVSKSDFDSFETSWDFTVHPLVKNHVATISEAYSLWSKECDDRFNQLKANEEELNRIFIDIYGLQDELDPYVEDKDVTVRKADLERDIKSLISYAVGCMFGRYSLDVEGLVYAGGNFDEKYCRWISVFGDKINENVTKEGSLVHGGWAGVSLYKYDGVRKNNKWMKASFAPDTDNIIPICDDEYFEDDIVGRFIKFIGVVYGESTLDENLSFIASALGGKGNPRDVIRSYFLNDFYKDHCKIYQKRPIYWLFDSGKKNGFKALMYIHRYQQDLIARLRTDYVHTTQSRLNHSIEMINTQLDGNLTSSEKVRLNKELTKFKAQAEEVKNYEEIVHHWADKMEPMDLDDGVKVNYENFKDLLAKIK